MAAVIRQIVNKVLNPTTYHKTTLSASLKNFPQPTCLLPIKRFLSTVTTPYEIVDSKEDNLAAKGATKCLHVESKLKIDLNSRNL